VLENMCAGLISSDDAYSADILNVQDDQAEVVAVTAMARPRPGQGRLFSFCNCSRGPLHCCNPNRFGTGILWDCRLGVH
jgi:hypothetical protein